jgi:Hemerythrin HHE cation binding domain
MRTTRDDLLLPRHHERLESLLEDLKVLSHGDDSRALCLCWAAFDRELGDHLRAEEEHLLPEFAHEHPLEARGLLIEHAEIRGLVAELGVTVELHLLRADVADRLIELLRAHARREDAMLYPWAMNHFERWPDDVKTGEPPFDAA